LAMAVALVLPHVIEDAEAQFGYGPRDFPVAYSLTIVGFLLVMLVDNVVVNQCNLVAPHEPHVCEDGTAPAVRHVTFDTDDAVDITIPDAFIADTARKKKEKVLEALEQDPLAAHSTSTRIIAHIYLALTQERMSLRHVVMFLAISLHAFMAGISLGSTGDKKTMMAIFWALMAHKFVEALALGGNFVRDGATIGQASLSVVLFAFVTPVGVGVGMCIASEHTLALVLNGISCGMFLYVGTIEVIAKELDGRWRDKNRLEELFSSDLLWVRLWKFTSVLTGSGVVLLMLFAIGEPDHH